jgi:dihydrofolate synthase/folylpolyglutamate synthase
MNYQQALDYLYSFIDYETMHLPRDAANYDLRRMEELLARLGKPHLFAKSVHIAGTKGKGSVAAMLASALIASGYTTGLYTSPHLIDLRERIQVNGELITEAELMAIVEELKPEAEAVNEKATYGKLTTFELLTALGFAHFKLKGIDFQVLEVGLGGRLDATNVINPEVSIITSISFDHTEVLGNTLTAIATEKAGIIKPGGVVVTSPQTEEVARVIEATCLSRGANLIRVGGNITWQSLGFDADRQSLQVKGRLNSYRLSIPLLGQHQLENTAVAVAALEVLAEKGFRISEDSIIHGLAQVNWPGRLQILRRHPLLVVDGAHNAYSAKRLKQSLEHYFGVQAKVSLTDESQYPHRAILIIGVSFDKDLAGIVSELAPIFDRVIVTRSRHPRAMAPAPIVAEFAKHGIEAQIAEDTPAALTLALSLAEAQDLICVTGSLFVVGEAIEQINK